MNADLPHDATVIDVEHRSSGTALWLRRISIVALALLCVAALTGHAGVRTGEARAERAGYRLAVEYPAVARAGLDTPFEITVHSDSGFDEELELAVTGDYFDLFETQGFHPEPSDETRDGSTLYLTFTAPESDTFVVAYDAYVQPSSQRGDDATVAVVDGSRVLVKVAFRTRLMP